MREEKKLQDKVIALCKSRDIFAANIAGVGMNGIPDLLVVQTLPTPVLSYHRVIFSELKASEKAARSEAQKKIGNLLLDAHANFDFIYSLEQFEKSLLY